MSSCIDGYIYQDFCIDEFISSVDHVDEEDKSVDFPLLTAYAAATIVRNETLTKQALNDLPQAFAPLLLLAALEQGRSHREHSHGDKRFLLPPSAFHIYKKWPQETLRFKSLLPALNRDYKRFHSVEEGFSILAFGGLFNRPHTHKLRTLDLTDYHLDQSHLKDMFDVYPYVLLPPEKKTLPAMLAALHASPDFQAMKNAKFKQKLEDLVQRKAKMWATEGFEEVKPHVEPEDRAPRLEIIFDKVELKVHKHAQSMFQLDLALAGCLREHTPIHLGVNKLIIRGSCFASKFPHPSFEKSSVGQDVLEAVGALPKQCVDSICLQWLPLRLLKESTIVVQAFPNVKRLSVKESMVRVEDQLSSRSSDQIYRGLAEMMHSFKQLNRLELFSLNIREKLGMLLCSVQGPLEFLSLEASAVYDQDLLQLATSPQLESLKELNLRDVCRYLYRSRSQVAELLPSSSGELPPSDESLLAVVRNLQTSNNLMVLNLSKNLFSDGSYAELCQLLRAFKVLRCLFVCDIMISFDLCVEMITSCVEIESLQGVVISCKDVYQVEASQHAKAHRTWDNLNRIAHEQKSLKRRESLRISIPKGRLYDIYVTHLLPGMGDWL